MPLPCGVIKETLASKLAPNPDIKMRFDKRLSFCFFHPAGLSGPRILPSLCTAVKLKPGLNFRQRQCCFLDSFVISSARRLIYSLLRNRSLNCQTLLVIRWLQTGKKENLSVIMHWLQKIISC